MRRAKGVHYKNITEAGIGLSEGIIVVFFTGIKTNIFQHNQTTLGNLQAIGPIPFYGNRLAKQLT